MANFNKDIKQQAMEMDGGPTMSFNSSQAEVNNSAKQQEAERPQFKTPPPQQGDGFGLNAPGGSGAPIIGATALLSAKYPSSFAVKNDRKSRFETRLVMLITLVLTALVVYGWSKWGKINFRASFDFTYNSGLIGGILMLLTLLYAIRKRVKLFKKLGGMDWWYYFHLIGGVFGPIIVIFHTSFSLKSINSTMAFVAMMLVVISGLVGRYIYTRIGYDLHRKIETISQTEQALIESIRRYPSELVENIERRLSTFALSCLAGPKDLSKMPLRFFAIRTASATCYVRASDDLNRMLRYLAQEEGWNMSIYKNLLDQEKRLLRAHINSVVEIAYVHLYERVLVRWRIIHIPLLYILFVTGVAHVVAVHMY